jgi:hypothetical protein
MMKCVITAGQPDGSWFTSYVFRSTQHGYINSVGISPLHFGLNLRIGMEDRNKVRIGKWSVGMFIGRSSKLAEVLKRRKISICCVQETKYRKQK